MPRAEDTAVDPKAPYTVDTSTRATYTATPAGIPKESAPTEAATAATTTSGIITQGMTTATPGNSTPARSQGRLTTMTIALTTGQPTRVVFTLSEVHPIRARKECRFSLWIEG